jgi:DNA repair protein RecO (recombination protein O)
MLHKTRGIVLHTVKYSDTKIIAHVYTASHGRQAYIISGSHSKKAANKINLLQPLSLLEIEAEYRLRRELQRTKEIQPAYLFHTIPYNVAKSTVSLFLAEILYKTLKEEEPNENLFDFLFNSIQLFDVDSGAYANFHLVFLVQLGKHLGFLPTNNFSLENKYFDLLNGKFVAYEYSKIQCLTLEESKVFKELLGLSFQNMHELQMGSMLRYALLENLIRFYSIHIENIGKIKSLEVLKEVFHS